MTFLFRNLSLTIGCLSLITSPYEIANFLFIHLGWVRLSNVWDILTPPSSVGMKTSYSSYSSSSSTSQVCAPWVSIKIGFNGCVHVILVMTLISMQKHTDAIISLRFPSNLWWMSSNILHLVSFKKTAYQKKSPCKWKKLQTKYSKNKIKIHVLDLLEIYTWKLLCWRYSNKPSHLRLPSEGFEK
jgi:hypothetical protein